MLEDKSAPQSERSERVGRITFSRWQEGQVRCSILVNRGTAPPDTDLWNENEKAFVIQLSKRDLAFPVIFFTPVQLNELC